MGLDTTHDCWHGSYSSFNRFREEIAKALDIPIGLMDGYYEVRTVGDVRSQMPLWAQEIMDNNLLKFLPIYWDILQPDAIHILLKHSDCDGIIEITDLIPIAERLEVIADQLPIEPFNMQEKARKFATGLRLAADLGEVVEFR